MVLDLAATGVPVTVTCRVLGLTKEGFYKWCANPVSARDWDEAHLINASYDVHADDPEFGHRFIADELHAAGLQTTERRVWRLCSQQHLFSLTIKRARKHGKKPGPPVCDDLVKRGFTAAGINELWLTDITEHHTSEGKLYMCAVKDVFSNRIVGFFIDSRMKSRLAVAAIDDAVARRGGPGAVAGCLVHSDYAEVFVNPRNPRLAWSEYLWFHFPRVNVVPTYRRLYKLSSCVLVRSGTPGVGVAALIA